MNEPPIELKMGGDINRFLEAGTAYRGLKLSLCCAVLCCAVSFSLKKEGKMEGTADADIQKSATGENTFRGALAGSYSSDVHIVSVGVIKTF